MGLIDDIRDDIITISTDLDTGFSVELIFEAPTGETATIAGIGTKIHWAVNAEGKQVNMKNARVSFVESLLVALGYPVRNSDNEVDLSLHRVIVKDSTGSDCTYVVNEWFPDRTVGYIVCILGDYNS